MKRFWQILFWGILILGIYALLPASEIATARQWIEAMLGRFR